MLKLVGFSFLLTPTCLALVISEMWQEGQETYQTLSLQLPRQQKQLDPDEGSIMPTLPLCNYLPEQLPLF